MKIQLGKSISGVIRDKKGLSLVGLMIYVTLAVILSLSLFSSVSNIWSKFLLTKHQEEFIIQKNQFFTLLAQDLTDVNANTFKIENTVADNTKQKILFETQESLIEIVQGDGHLVYKRKDKVTNKSTAVDFGLITSSSFNKIDEVCVGDGSPTDCYEVNNTVDIVLRAEKRIVRNPISYKTGRVIHYD